jgi:pimeloyl-ACP methyl ester carboxylesterase
VVVESGGRQYRRWPWFAVVIALTSAAVGLGPTLVRSNPWPFDLHTVGTACRDDSAWVCGSIPVPLNRAAPNSGSIVVQFRILPRRLTRAASAGTIVVVSGGPGDSSMDQKVFAERTFGPLLGDHDLLLVDNRGTGASGRINCPAVQTDGFALAAVAQCRKILGSKADDYGTIAAVDDLEAVLDRVDAQRVDLYGESYGTFFAQVFALRYPKRLKRVVLDGALPLAVDPWARNSLPRGLAYLRESCRTDLTCGAFGDPVALVAKTLSRLGLEFPAAVASRGAQDLALLLANAGRAGSAYRELSAASRAYLAGDVKPLFRLLYEAAGGGYGNSPDAEGGTAFGLLLADECTDYPQPFDLHASLAVQKRQLASAYKRISSTVSRAFSPFTPQEALRSETQCLGWPAPTNPTPQSLGRAFPRVPTLVLEGGLDTVTPPEGARAVADEFRGSRYVEVPFVGHITALNDTTGCAAKIAATFMESSTVDTACLARMKAPPHVEAFPETFTQETPIVTIGNRAKIALSVNERRILAITRDAVSDVLWRWAALQHENGKGLRGGTFASEEPAGAGFFEVRLAAIRWTADTTITGDISTYPVDETMEGAVTVATPVGRFRFEISSPRILGPSTVETITGTINGHKIAVKVDAKLGL